MAKSGAQRSSAPPETGDALFRSLVEHAPDMVFRIRLGPDRAVDYVSPSSLGLTGYTPGEISGAGDFAQLLVLPEDILAYQRWRARGGADPLVARWRKKDGTVIWVETRTVPILDEHSSVVALGGAARDITEQMEIQERLTESKRALAEAQLLGNVGNWSWDALEDRVECSDHLYRIFGMTARAFGATFESFIDRVHPDDQDRVRAIIAQSLRDHQPFEFEERIVRPDGEVRVLRAVGRVHVDEDGHPKRLSGVCQDITEQRRADVAVREALVREREATRTLRHLDGMKSEFLGAISHQLRTPLSVVLGIAMTLERGSDRIAPGDARLLIERLSANAVRLEQLVADLLDLDRLSRGTAELRAERTDVGALARRVAEELAPAGRIVRVEAPSLEAFVDPPKVERIVESLLSNAARHTPEGSAVWLRLRRKGSGILITVEDEGAGIPEDRKDSVFEPFSVGSTGSHAPGTGIGLALVASYAALHGGRAWVQDRGGGGSSFRVWLPGVRRSAAEARRD